MSFFDVANTTRSITFFALLLTTTPPTLRRLTIGGPATILNNSSSVIHAGDTIAWTFYSESGTSTQPRAAHGAVRRIGIRVADL